MSCKNTFLLSFLVIALMYFVVTKPIHYKGSVSYMNDVNNSNYKYGDVPLYFNKDPSDMNYYSIGYDDEKLSIPDSQILTNKSLYKYESLLVPKISHLLNINDNTIPHKNLSDGTHYSDIFSKRSNISNYSYDKTYNKHSTIKESYFD